MSSAAASDDSSVPQEGGFRFQPAFQKSDHVSFNDSFSEKYALDKPFDEVFAKHLDVERLDVEEKQALQFNWILWEQYPQQGYNKTSSYEEQYQMSVQCKRNKSLCVIRTLGDFFQTWNVLPQPSCLLDNKRFVREQKGNAAESVGAKGSGAKTKQIASYCLFKEGVKVAWEDPINAKGGDFSFKFKYNALNANSKALVDEMWNQLVFTVVGGENELLDMVVGLRMCDRYTGATKSQTISFQVWYTSMDDSPAATALTKSGKNETEVLNMLLELLSTSMLIRPDGSRNPKIWDGEPTPTPHKEAA